MKFIPPFGLGTFRLKDQVAVDSVRTGLELGYRHIDTAQIYGNEAEVGQAIADSGVARRELFVTTKVWTENLGSGRVIPSLRESLQRHGGLLPPRELVETATGAAVSPEPLLDYLEEKFGAIYGL